MSKKKEHCYWKKDGHLIKSIGHRPNVSSFAAGRYRFKYCPVCGLQIEEEVKRKLPEMEMPDLLDIGDDDYLVDGLLNGV